MRGRVALGSDSRLSGARDLLCELRVAHELSGLDEATLAVARDRVQRPPAAYRRIAGPSRSAHSQIS